MCDPLDDIVNGQVMLPIRTQGSLASYSCETGYNLIGNSSRMCQMITDGLEWSDEEPICQSELKTNISISHFVLLVLPVWWTLLALHFHKDFTSGHDTWCNMVYNRYIGCTHYSRIYDILDFYKLEFST